MLFYTLYSISLDLFAKLCTMNQVAHMPFTYMTDVSHPVKFVLKGY